MLGDWLRTPVAPATTLELHRYLSVLRSRLWLIVATTALAGAVGYLGADSTATYTSRSTLYVGSTSFDVTQGDLSNDRVTALQSIVLTFSRMIDSQPIALRAVQRLDLDLTADHVVNATTTSQEPGTQLLYINVSDPDPALAQSLANGLADVFVETVQEFEPTSSEGDVPRLPAYVFELAQLPTVPEGSQRLPAAVLAGLFGLLASAGIAFLLDYLDLSVKTAADVEQRLELPVLGVIPAIGDHVPLNEWYGPRLRREPSP